MAITTKIIRIGNSKGIRIPKSVLEQTGMSDRVTLRVERGKLIVKAAENSRQGWTAAFKKGVKSAGQEMLIPDEVQNQWDEEEWEW